MEVSDMKDYNDNIQDIKVTLGKIETNINNMKEPISKISTLSEDIASIKTHINWILVVGGIIGSGILFVAGLIFNKLP